MAEGEISLPEDGNFWVETSLPEDEGGTKYFYHYTSRETSYSVPEGAVVVPFALVSEFETSNEEEDDEDDESGADEEGEEGADGVETAPVVIRPEDLDDWVEVVDEDGDTFFYNEKLDVSIWQDPRELVRAQISSSDASNLASESVDQVMEKRDQQSAESEGKDAEGGEGVEGGAEEDEYFAAGARARRGTTAELMSELESARARVRLLESENSDLRQRVVRLQSELVQAKSALRSVEEQRVSVGSGESKGSVDGLVVSTDAEPRRSTAPSVPPMLRNSRASGSGLSPLGRSMRALGISEDGGRDTGAVTVGAKGRRKSLLVSGGGGSGGGGGAMVTKQHKGGDKGDLPMLAKVSFLKSVPLFHSLSEAQFALLAERMRRVEVAVGQTVIEQGHVGTRFYVIVHGRVAVHKQSEGHAKSLAARRLRRERARLNLERAAKGEAIESGNEEEEEEDDEEDEEELDEEEDVLQGGLAKFGDDESENEGEEGGGEGSNVRKYGPVVAELSEGFWFGEQSLLNKAPRSATCVALCDLELLMLDRNAFGEVLSSIGDLLGSYSQQAAGAETTEGLALARHVNTYALALDAARRETVSSEEEVNEEEEEEEEAGGKSMDADGNGRNVLNREYASDAHLPASRALVETMSIFSPELDVLTVLARAASALRSLLAAEHCSIFLYDPNSNDVFVRASGVSGVSARRGRPAGLTGHASASSHFLLDGASTSLRRVPAAEAGPLGYAAGRRALLVVSDVSADDRFTSRGRRTSSFAQSGTSSPHMLPAVAEDKFEPPHKASNEDEEDDDESGTVESETRSRNVSGASAQIALPTWSELYVDLARRAVAGGTRVEAPVKARSSSFHSDEGLDAALSPAVLARRVSRMSGGATTELSADGLRSLAVAPVLDSQGKVVALIAIANRGAVSSSLGSSLPRTPSHSGSPSLRPALRRAPSSRRFSRMRTFVGVARTARQDPGNDPDLETSPFSAEDTGSPLPNDHTGSPLPSDIESPRPIPTSFTGRDQRIIAGLADSVALSLSERAQEVDALTGMRKCQPLHGLRRQFQMEVIGITGVNTPRVAQLSRAGTVRKFPSATKVIVEMTLYHGGVALGGMSSSSKKAALAQVRRQDGTVDVGALWRQWLRAPLRYCNLPAATRAIFNVRHKDKTLVGWAGCTLFTSQQVLRSGTIDLRLWPGRADAATAAAATVLDNRHTKDAPTLTVAFQSFPDPVVRVSLSHSALHGVVASLDPVGPSEDLRAAESRSLQHTSSAHQVTDIDSELKKDSSFTLGAENDSKTSSTKKDSKTSSTKKDASDNESESDEEEEEEEEEEEDVEVEASGRDSVASSGEVPLSEPVADDILAARADRDEFLRCRGLLERMAASDPLYRLAKAEQEAIWRCRYFILEDPGLLPKFLLSVPWECAAAAAEAHALLDQWASPGPLEALQLLDAKFPDPKVRAYAVSCLENMSDSELSQFLLQLAQVLKYEPFLDSALSRFLLRRALRRRRVVGHQLFWLLKSEMHIPEVVGRYGIFLEQYLRNCDTHRAELGNQMFVLNRLESIANQVKAASGGKAERVATLRSELPKVVFPDAFQLPLSPRMVASGIDVERCRVMSSKKLPLWLTFRSAARPDTETYTVLFKAGDDLRQDQLTLQVLRVMDALWKAEGLDLCMSPYGCVSTGDEIGMLEIVLDSATLAGIVASRVRQGHKGFGRKLRAAMAAYKEDTLTEWLSKQEGNDKDMDAVRDRFLRSCAGYCVATYVLGIGDRHNDNIMVNRDGRLFHIDFGHFLGNFKSKFGYKRERAPFVFTPLFAHVLGGEGSPLYNKFVDTCCQAYNILRRNANLVITLFFLMISCGIPELRSEKDLKWLQEKLVPHLSDDDAAKHFTEQIGIALRERTTLFNDACHLLAHA